MLPNSTKKPFWEVHTTICQIISIINKFVKTKKQENNIMKKYNCYWQRHVRLSSSIYKSEKTKINIHSQNV